MDLHAVNDWQRQSDTAVPMELTLYMVPYKLFWLYQGPEYAWSYYMFDRFLKVPQILNMSELYKQWLNRVLNMSEYETICLRNAWIASLCLNSWILLNVTEHACKYLNKLFWLCWILNIAHRLDRVLNMPLVLYMPGFWICCDIDIIIFLL